MRLFFAIDLPEPLRRDIAAQARALAAVRPVATDRLHLTLKFVGDAAGDAVIEAARGAVAGPPFGFELCGGGVFPGRARPRVLWVGARGDDGRLAALASALDEALEPLGVPSERGPFVPHVTLARVRGPVPRTTVEAVLNLGRIGVVQVSEVALYESELRPEGAVHRAIARLPLAG
jgi:2'-5' RNA ligase